MKNLFLFILSIILNVSVFAQDGFQEGYFINNQGNKIDCLIKNVDWKNNPSSFKYSLSKDGEQQIASIDEVQEFGITGISKYRRFTIELDRSSTITSKLSYKKEPLYKTETIFLRILIEGKANLYVFEGPSMAQYYYQFDDKKISNLIYKQFLSPDNTVLENTKYKFQLFNDLSCGNQTTKSIKNIKYQEKELLNYFLAYNQCAGSESSNYARKKSNNFILSFRPGISLSSIIHKRDFFIDKDLGNMIHARFGIEAEAFLLFNHRRWSLLIEPSYSTTKIKKDIGEESSSFTLNLLEIPFGIRHYIPMNNGHKFFINVGFLSAFSLNSEIIRNYATLSDGRVNGNLFAGIGYKFNDKVGLEYRYAFRRDALDNYVNSSAELTVMSIIFSYKIL